MQLDLHASSYDLFTLLFLQLTSWITCGLRLHHSLFFSTRILLTSANNRVNELRVPMCQAISADFLNCLSYSTDSQFQFTVNYSSLRACTSKYACHNTCAHITSLHILMNESMSRWMHGDNQINMIILVFWMSVCAWEDGRTVCIHSSCVMCSNSPLSEAFQKKHLWQTFTTRIK